MRYVPHGSESALAAPNHASPSLPTTEQEQKLAGAIAGAVCQETGGRIRNLHVAVQRHEVVLSGCCDSFYLKQIAQHAAMSLHKSGQLTNQIEVLCSPQDRPNRY